MRPKLPDDLRGFQWQQRWSLVKLWYRVPKIHYEVWFHRRIGLIEIGLHFEADRETNDRLLAHFEENLIVAKAMVSERIEAEPWDKGWARVYEMVPIAPLDDAFLEHVSTRLARLIETMEPLMP